MFVRFCTFKPVCDILRCNARDAFRTVYSCFFHIELQRHTELPKKQIVNKIRKGLILQKFDEIP